MEMKEEAAWNREGRQEGEAGKGSPLRVQAAVIECIRHLKLGPLV